MSSNPPRVVAITQARMLSTRLPHKVTLPVGGKPLLLYQVDRLKRARCIDGIAVATADTPDCDRIVELCESNGIDVVRGDEHDVLSRFVRCARYMEADVVVRVTSDCPLIDPVLIDTLVGLYLEADWDFCALDIPKTFPRGVDFEVFSAELLYQADREATSPREREHVAPFIYTQPERFKCHWMAGSLAQGYRFCVDTVEDYEVVSRLADVLQDMPDYGVTDIARLFDEHPDWVGINAHIAQKTH